MSSKYRIAILDMNNGQANEGMRCIKMLVQQFLNQDGVDGDYQVFEVRNKTELPEESEFDIYVSSGGPGSPLISNEPWEIKYFELLDSILNYNLTHYDKKHLFLICHSFQLACLHWDLAKVTKRRSTSFGVLPIFKTLSGESEPLFEGLNDPFYAVDSRDYQVVGPKEWKLESLQGKVLCREKSRPHIPLERAVMAIRFTNEIFGTQFHPEADSEGMLRYFQKEEKREQTIKRFGNKKYLEMIDFLDDEDKILKTNGIILPKFLELSAAAIDKSRYTIV
tara:strand:- start:193 stop:1029 length:837 start_codon:yes stop_codon:yes gene_type:complete